MVVYSKVGMVWYGVVYSYMVLYSMVWCSTAQLGRPSPPEAIIASGDTHKLPGAGGEGNKSIGGVVWFTHCYTHSHSENGSGTGSGTGTGYFWSRFRSFLVLMIGPSPVKILVLVPVLVPILVTWLCYRIINFKNAQKY